ncbi:hypothetical protein V4E86_22510 [Burkholderia pseudomallei]|uniref:hypothetical protein n=1 Tax=Burkholderia pseudomallei TaxID=28450 RepID=UPI001F303F17|nr:hypothetical protein [Burkholderia pseudomallei]
MLAEVGSGRMRSRHRAPLPVMVAATLAMLDSESRTTARPSSMAILFSRGMGAAITLAGSGGEFAAVGFLNKVKKNPAGLFNFIAGEGSGRSKSGREGSAGAFESPAVSRKDRITLDGVHDNEKDPHEGERRATMILRCRARDRRIQIPSKRGTTCIRGYGFGLRIFIFR